MSNDTNANVMTPKVDVQYLLQTLAEEANSMGISMGVRMALITLHNVTKRALELDDRELLKHLETLCLVVMEAEKAPKKPEAR